MAERILLQDKTPAVDADKIGISYSGGGSLVLVELGIARAFVQLGVRPAVIAGASAGAIAGAAHALDPATGKGIDMAARVLSGVSNGTLGLTPLKVVWRALTSLIIHMKSAGDNGTIGPLIRDALKHDLGLERVTLATFRNPDYPKLMIVATDVRNATSVWFTPDSPLADAPLEEALIASSAIPLVFPWRSMQVGGQETTLVDGGVVTNQPLSKLVDDGCGKLYACAVGPTGPQSAPENGIQNAIESVHAMMHQTTKLEEDYVRLKLKEEHGVVYHLHPQVACPVSGFNFTPEIVKQVMDDACTATVGWIEQNKLF